MRDSIRIERGEAPFQHNRYTVYLQNENGDERKLGHYDVGFALDAYFEPLTHLPRIEAQRDQESSIEPFANVHEAIEYVIQGTSYESLFDPLALLF